MYSQYYACASILVVRHVSMVVVAEELACYITQVQTCSCYGGLGTH